MLHTSALGFAFGRLGLLVLAVCSVALNLSNCKTQQSKTPDTTPPTIRWNVRNAATNAAQDINGSGNVSAKLGESYKVMCIVNDPEGVHEITLGGGGSYTCTQSGLGQTSSFLQNTDKQTLNPNADGTVLNQIFLIRDANLDFKCNSGFTFSGGNLSLTCNGLNYNNGQVSGTLNFNVTP